MKKWLAGIVALGGLAGLIVAFGLPNKTERMPPSTRTDGIDRSEPESPSSEAPVAPEQDLDAATAGAAPPEGRHMDAARPVVIAPAVQAKTSQVAAVATALQKTGTKDAAMYARMAKAGLPYGPEVDALVQMRRAGASADELRTFVQTKFPPNALLRAIAIGWIENEKTPGRKDEDAETPRGAPLLKPTGVLQPRPATP